MSPFLRACPVGSRGEVLFRVAGREVFVFAGLWDLGKDGKPAFTGSEHDRGDLSRSHARCADGRGGLRMAR